MTPSAAALEALTFNEAIKPQQRALQLLQRAEALFNDIRVTQSSPGQGQGGQQPGQDMAEMFELEMDLERNQYEQPDTGPSPSAEPQEALDDIFEKLAELAHRQQALAEEKRRNQPLTREERWRQEQLAREIEQLQRDLETIEQQGNSGNESSDSASQTAESLREQLEQVQQALQEALNNGNSDDNGNSDSQDDTSQLAQNDASDDNSGSDGQNEQANSDQSESRTDEQTAGDHEAHDGASGEGNSDAVEAANRALQEALNEFGEARARDLQNRISTSFYPSNERQSSYCAKP